MGRFAPGRGRYGESLGRCPRAGTPARAAGPARRPRRARRRGIARRPAPPWTDGARSRSVRQSYPRLLARRRRAADDRHRADRPAAPAGGQPVGEESRDDRHSRRARRHRHRDADDRADGSAGRVRECDPPAVGGGGGVARQHALSRARPRPPAHRGATGLAPALPACCWRAERSPPAAARGAPRAGRLRLRAAG